MKDFWGRFLTWMVVAAGIPAPCACEYVINAFDQDTVLTANEETFDFRD